jgi:hypothetical protein
MRLLGPALGTGRHDGTRQNGTFDEYDSMACFRTTAIFDGVWPRPKFSTILHTAFHVYFGDQLATTLSRVVADAMMADEDRPMIPTIETAPKAAAANLSSGRFQEEYVCWSRMQAEAGQRLDAIIARKELERRAGDGSFLWGVGNAPAVVANVLARAHVPVRAVFSIMKSRPKVVDAAPARTVAWRRYIDAQGVDRPLPPHALVTSRGDSASGAKRIHYALMCRSNTSLALRRGEPFDPAAFRNVGGAGAPVGTSQVTALLRRVGVGADASDYEANLTAWLADGYWVRLIDPIELDRSKQTLLDGLGSCAVGEWCSTVAEIRRGPLSNRGGTPEGAFL